MYCDLTRFKAEMTNSGYFSKLAKKVSRHVLVSLVLVFSFQTMSFAEVKQAEIEKLGKTIVTLSKGKTITYQELKNLSEDEQDSMIQGLSPKEKLYYKRWYLNATNQETEQLKKDIAAINAYTEQTKKDSAAINAYTEQTKKDTAAINAQLKSSRTELATKSNSVVNVYRNDLKNGKKLSKKDKEMIEFLLDPEFKLRDLGMTQVTFDGLTELLRNSKNFE